MAILGSVSGSRKQRRPVTQAFVPMTKPADESDPVGGSPAHDDASGFPDEEYFARIEEHFGRRRGGPLVLSPKDWQLLERWYSKGIPLAVVLRGINRAFDQFRLSGPRPDRINSLRYCRQHVEETWEEHREARTGRRRRDDSAATDQALDHLGAAADACRATATATGDEDVRTILSGVADELEALARRVVDGDLGPRRVDQEARALEETLEARLAAAEDADDSGKVAGGSRRESLDLPPFSPYGI